MRDLLPHKFFARPALRVAEDLLGKYLVRNMDGGNMAFMVTETEAYVGPDDQASHSFGRRRTARNEIMYQKPGTIYVYFTYGMHYMLNIVTDAEEYPAAILIRGLEGVNGPGRLTKKLNIDKTLNGKMMGKSSGLWFEDRGVRIPRSRIQKMPRVGIGYAGEWKDKPYRFVLAAVEKKK